MAAAVLRPRRPKVPPVPGRYRAAVDVVGVRPGRRPVGSGGRRPPFGTGVNQVAEISAQQGLETAVLALGWAAGSTRLGSHLQIVESAPCELVPPETLVDSPPETLLPAAFPARGVCQVVSFPSREVGRADGEIELPNALARHGTHEPPSSDDQLLRGSSALDRPI